MVRVEHNALPLALGACSQCLSHWIGCIKSGLHGATKWHTPTIPIHCIVCSTQVLTPWSIYLVQHATRRRLRIFRGSFSIRCASRLTGNSTASEAFSAPTSTQGALMVSSCLSVGVQQHHTQHAWHGICCDPHSVVAIRTSFLIGLFATNSALAYYPMLTSSNCWSPPVSLQS